MTARSLLSEKLQMTAHELREYSLQKVWLIVTAIEIDKPSDLRSCTNVAYFIDIHICLKEYYNKACNLGH